MAYEENEEARKKLISELGQNLLKMKEISPAIVCMILAGSVDKVLDLWRKRCNF
jgi:hypothetical protein